MSPKSRPPKSGGKGGKKGRKGKKEQLDTTRYREVVEETGPSFGIVVLIGLLMSLPTLMAFFDNSLEFRPMIIRLLAALLVSWLLCQLVYSVIKSFPTAEDDAAAHPDARDPHDRDDYRGYGDGPYDGRAAS